MSKKDVPRNEQVKILPGQRYRYQRTLVGYNGGKFKVDKYGIEPTMLECDGLKRWFPRRTRRAILRSHKVALKHFPKAKRKIKAK